MRDFQRSRVYAFEYKFVGTSPRSLNQRFLSLEEVEALTSEVLAVYRPGYGVSIHDGRGRRSAVAITREQYGIIKIPKFCRRPWIVIHEAAHLCTPDRHGPKFVSVYLSALALFLGFDLIRLRREAVRFGLEVGPKQDLDFETDEPDLQEAA